MMQNNANVRAMAMLGNGLQFVAIRDDASMSSNDANTELVYQISEFYMNELRCYKIQALAMLLSSYTAVL